MLTIILYLTLTGSNPEHLKSVLESESCNLFKWFQDNGMKANSDNEIAYISLVRSIMDYSLVT